MSRPKNNRSALLIVLLALLAARLAAGGFLTWWQGVTIDEPDFLYGGRLAWMERGYWIDVDNPPLLKLIFTIPSLLADLRMPEREDFTGEFERADHYALGKALLFQLNERGQAAFLIYSARAVTLIIFVALAMAWWGEMRRRHRRRSEQWAAMAAFALLLLDPTMLSLSSLAVLDTAAAMTSALALIYTLRWSGDIERRSLIPVALLWAAAITIKFTSLILFVITAMMLFLRLAGNILGDRIDWPRAPYFNKLFTRRLILSAVVCFGAVWAIYGFEWGRMIDRMEPYARRRGESSYAKMEALPPAGRAVLLPLRVPIPMPSFFTGVARIFRAGGIEKRSWLLGEIHERGSRLYYLIIFALKTPLIVLLAAGLGAGALARRWWRAWRKRRLAHGRASERIWPLCVVILFVIFVFPRTNNMGYRYLLPLLPFVYMLAAEGFAWILNLRKPQRLAAMIPIIGLLMLDAWCLKSTWPNPLAFVNAAGGGPRQAWHIATDSNVDWGQEIRQLKYPVSEIQYREFKTYGGATKPYGLIYTPDALDFYGIDIVPLDEAAWKNIEGYIRGDDSSTSPPVTLIWSATKATGFSPAPPGAQEFLLDAMQSAEPEPISWDFIFSKGSPTTVYQYGQSYFFMTLK